MFNLYPIPTCLSLRLGDMVLYNSSKLGEVTEARREHHSHKVKTRYLRRDVHDLRDSDFPNFSVSGSIRGMKELYYGKECLLVRQGKFIYNVTTCPKVYYKAR